MEAADCAAALRQEKVEGWPRALGTEAEHREGHRVLRCGACDSRETLWVETITELSALCSERMLWFTFGKQTAEINL